MLAANRAGQEGERDILGHWIWALPVLLVVAYLSISQIDLYPPTVDEFYSMYNSGWITNSPYSPIEVLQSLELNSPNHTPLYFLLLNVWGNLVGYDIVLGRAPTIFAGLLALSMIFRLTRDFVAPTAGFFALLIVSSNAFYNYFIPHVRMYPLLLFLSALVLWLYLRIVYQQPCAKRRDYFALAVASNALANVHAFSALLFASLGVYHLFIAPKDRRWAGVSLAVSAALLIFSPWIVVLITGGIDRTFEYWQLGSATVGDILSAWLAMTFNGSLVLPLISIAGVIIGRRTAMIRSKPYILLCPIYIIVLGFTAWLTGGLGAHSMRLTMSGWPPTILFLSAGLYALYRVRKSLGLIVIVWILAGLIFQQTAVWRPYLEGRILHMDSPPWHAISRKLLAYPSPAPALSFRIQFQGLSWPGHIDYPQRKYYFERHGSSLKYFDAIESLQRHVFLLAITEPAFRVFYREADIDAAQATELENIFLEADYDLCFDLELIQDIRISEYRWASLRCEEPSVILSSLTDYLEYEFYGSALNAEADRLAFTDQWTARIDAVYDNHMMSFQVISDDWRNEAQLDLPLVHDGVLRQFTIDVSNVPPGKYRLMLILYDKFTGEKASWIDNAGDVPSLQELTSFVIPKRE